MDILWSSGYTDFCDNIYLDECSKNYMQYVYKSVYNDFKDNW